MLPTSIKHGDLVIDMESDGSVQITRQSNMQAIRLSLTEWHYLLLVSGLHGWGICPPGNADATALQGTG